MKKLNEKTIGLAVMLTMTLLFVLIMVFSSNDNKTEDIILNTSPQMDTVEVIIEYDGEREIRWYTLDTCYGRK